MHARYLIASLWILVSTVGTATAFAAQEFTFDNMMLYTLSQQSSFDYSKHWKPLVCTFDPEFWDQNHANEFKVHGRAEKVISQIKSQLAEAPPDGTFTTEEFLKLGEYDFSKNEFAFKPFGTYHKSGMNWVALNVDAEYSSDITAEDYLDLKKEYRILFNNTNTLVTTGVPFDPEAAEKFVNEKEKNKQDKAVYCKVTFHIVNTLEDDVKYKVITFLAEIDSIEVYLDKEKTTLLTTYGK
ncbi:DUF4852 domain-containing protein [Desulfogranum japonicum]|uniref:DUF4852 domain-containing protein n=1 Tax=Desulfogranum japonicum TaxID=231447 RepID=UPI000404A414|nr:DUF4852 domain-containing protein [Desulfogranum japonicum]